MSGPPADTESLRPGWPVTGTRHVTLDRAEDCPVTKRVDVTLARHLWLSLPHHHLCLRPTFARVLLSLVFALCTATALGYLPLITQNASPVAALRSSALVRLTLTPRTPHLGSVPDSRKSDIHGFAFFGGRSCGPHWLLQRVRSETRLRELPGSLFLPAGAARGIFRSEGLLCECFSQCSFGYFPFTEKATPILCVGLTP